VPTSQGRQQAFMVEGIFPVWPHLFPPTTLLNERIKNKKLKSIDKSGGFIHNR
jgi:hypothetical protein